MPSQKSNLLKKISKINSYGFRRKRTDPLSALAKHPISFEGKKYSLSLSEIKSKILDLKNKHRQVKEKRLENIKFKGKFDSSDLRVQSLTLRLEISKLEILENLVLQKELIKQTPHLEKQYSKTISNISLKVDSLFLNDKNFVNKKYTFLSIISKEITRQLKLRNEESRQRLFKYVNKEILSKPLDQIRLDI